MSIFSEQSTNPQNEEQEGPHQALIVFNAPGEFMVIDYNSVFLGWFLEGELWVTSETMFFDSVAMPDKRMGVWVLTFEIGGDAEEYWPENEVWERPSEDNWSTIIHGE